MRRLFLFMILIFSGLGLEAQNSGIDWTKAMDPNFQPGNSGIIWQGLTQDAQQNIYLAYSLNGSDTTSTFITKFSPAGEQLWRRTLRSNMQFIGVSTQFDHGARLFTDTNGHIVLMAYGYDTVNGYDLLMYKFDQNGSLLSAGGMNSNILNIGKYVLIRGYNRSMDRYHYAVYRETNDSTSVDFFFLDGNFNFLFKRRVVKYSSVPGGLPSIGSLTLQVLDSSIFYIARYYAGDSTRITCLDIAADTVRFEKDFNYFRELHHVFTYDTQFVLMGSRMLRLNKHGNTLADVNLPGTCYNPSLDRGFLNFHSVVFGAGFQVINSKVCRYHLDADSLIMFDVNVPLVSGMYPGYVQRKGNWLYVYGHTNKAGPSNLITYPGRFYFLKTDTLGNVIDYFSTPEVNYGWTHAGIQFAESPYDDFVVFQSLIKPNDTTPAKTYDYLYKGRFGRDPNIRGICFYDANANCLPDSNEPRVPNNLVRLMPENVYTLTDSSGAYQFSKLSGSGSVSVDQVFDGGLCDTVLPVDMNMLPAYDSLNFAYQMPAVMSCRPILYSQAARPGFLQSVFCAVRNRNPFTMQGISFRLRLDSAFNLQSAYMPLDSVQGQDIYWHFDSLPPNAIHTFRLVVQVPVTVPVGYNYQHTVNMMASGMQFTCSANDTTSGVVTGSWDPNDKLAEPVGLGPWHHIPNDTRIKYTIRFQNTGNDTAFHVRIFDELDPNLDISTLELIGASHHVQYKLDNRVLKCYFDHIYLPDSNRDEANSHGFVQFSIKPVQGIDGREIRNNAAIYFDYNIPVITNTVFHTIGQYIPYVSPYIAPPMTYSGQSGKGMYYGPLPPDASSFDLSVHPNPALTDKVTVRMALGYSDAFSLRICDVSGREVSLPIRDMYYSDGFHEFPVDIKGLKAGWYSVELRSRRMNQVRTVRLVIGN